MTDTGYVYILINPSMDNLVKIGKTNRDPELRAKELSSTTGVPTPFIVVYECYFEECSNAEKFVHTDLENKGYRVSLNREFFEIPVKDAIDSVIKAKTHFEQLEHSNQYFSFNEEDIFSSDNEDDFLENLDYSEKTQEPWEEMFDLAETYYYGLGDEIVDYEEALIYYLKAIKLGGIQGYKKIGIMYSDGEGVNVNKKKAFQYFKEGAKKGDIECYSEIAKLFSDQNNIDNSLKSWKKYFELSKEVNYIYVMHYLNFIKTNNLKLNYVDKIKPVLDPLIDWTLDVIDTMLNTENEYLIPYYEDALKYYQEIKQLI